MTSCGWSSDLIPELQAQQKLHSLSSKKVSTESKEREGAGQRREKKKKFKFEKKKIVTIYYRDISSSTPTNALYFDNRSIDHTPLH